MFIIHFMRRLSIDQMGSFNVKGISHIKVIYLELDCSACFIFKLYDALKNNEHIVFRLLGMSHNKTTDVLIFWKKGGKHVLCCLDKLYTDILVK